MSRNLIVVVLFGIACAAFGQQQQQEDDGQTPLKPNQRMSSPPDRLGQGNFTNGPCDPSDMQATGCDTAGSGQSLPAGTKYPTRANDPSRELWRNANPERYSKPQGLEDSQFERIVEPPTEFQKFVETSVGKKLVIYGAELFDRVPSTYAPVDRIPVGGDYAVGPGDELDIRVWGQISFEQKLVVDRTGSIFLPKVGLISVAGLHFSELPTALKTSIGRVFRNFELSVSMGRLRSIQVFVMGKARRPGTYTISSLSTLVNALFVSGGPSAQGSMRNIELKRNGQTVTRFDMYDLLLRGDKTKDVILNQGDVVFIPTAGARVAVAGSVEVPAIYEIPQHYPLREILNDAGGLSPVAAGQHVLLERIDNRATLDSRNVSLTGAGLDITVQNGDIIRVLNLVPRFSKTVSLKGNVSDPVRLPWREGMRVTDLIPEKQALLTRGYWSEHNHLQTEAQAFTEEVVTANADNTIASALASDRVAKQRKFNQKNDLQPPAPDINWTYAAIERLDEQTLSTRLIPFNLGKAVLEHDESANLLLQPGDVVTVFSNADFTTPMAEQSRIVRLEGEVKMAGIYSVRPGETLRQLVERAGGLTDKAYLYAAAFTRESTRREQQKQLGDYLDQTEKELDQNAATVGARTISPDQQAAFRIDLERQREMLERLRKTPASGRIVLDLKPESQGANALPELPLQNGDRLIVPGTPATVSVIGTVYNQSTFLYAADSSIRDYLKLSGGPTKFADVSQMFVIRADGSVASRAKLSHFESIAVRPGDALMVPSNSMKVSKIRNFLDWSQVLSGFGIAAAAVNVLK